MSQLLENLSDDSPEIEIPLLIPENRFENFLKASPFPTIVTDYDFKFEFVNPAARKFLGYTHGQAIGGKLQDIVRISEAASPDLNQFFKTGDDYHGEWEFFSRKTKQWLYCEVFAKTTEERFRFFYLNDLTERRQTERLFLADEERRWQSQKTEALERLAGGIAHDFNNLLAVILLHTDMLKLQLPPDSLLLHRINEIKAVSNDAAGIVRQLLAFGRKQPMNPTPVVLNKIIGELSQILPRQLGPEIKTVINLDPDLGVCFVDQNQIAQAIINLAVNAKDAMPNGGTLKIETANITVDKTTSHAAQSSGSYMQISISDNGKGMTSNTEEHIFEPFFSTKESDKGAGLGLATVYGIVKQSGGFIWVESELGVGTTFKIQFPRVDRPKTVATKYESDDLLEFDNETILLVDDDKAVRRIAAEILRLSGYDVLEAESGMEAIEIAQSYKSKIHLLLTDCSMPKMNGNVTAESIRGLFPQISVLLMSGNIEDISSRQKASETGYSFIGKPFSSATLTRKVRDALRS